MSDDGVVKQWLRECRVVVGTGGKGLDVSGLRIQFEITKTIGRTPNPAIIKIYNLAPANAAKVKTEFDEVLVNVGYKNATLLIFRGNIRYVYQYRDGVDWITEIDAADGDKDYSQATCNVTLAKQTDTSQMIDQVVTGFTSTKKGYIKTGTKKRARGRTFSGMARDALDRIAQDEGAHWSIQDGALELVPVDATLPMEAVRIASDTGMLGAPELDDKGVTFKCLLNPRLRPNGKAWLDNAGIKASREVARIGESQQFSATTKKRSANAKAPKLTAIKHAAKLDSDGVYKIYKVEHKGDTHGSDWFTEASCVSLDSPIPKEAK